MKKIISLVILVIVVVIGGVYLLKINNPVDRTQPIEISDYKNTSYVIDGQKVTLVNGVSEVEAAPGAATKVVTKYFGNDLKKDLNNDGREDVAFILTQETGGSGTFYYVVAALNTPNGYVGSDAVLLGDRIAPQNIESGSDNSIVVNYAERNPGEPMTTQPFVGKSLKLILNPTTLQFDEVAQDFEGEANPSTMSLTMKTWTWINAQYVDGTTLAPKNKTAFSITFKNDDTFFATTDCNGIAGKYTAASGKLIFSNTASTLKFCEESQETEFSSLLTQTSGYMFTSKGELVLTLKNNSGSVYFK